MEFSQYLGQLKDASARLTVSELQHVDSLTPEQAQQLRSAWPQIEGERRRWLVSQLVELAEDNVELNFDAVFFAALEDEDAPVRLDAVRGLWEYEGRDLIDPLLRLVERDEEPEVRSEAALALGRYVMMSALGRLQERHSRKVEEVLRRVIEDEVEEDEVRGRALEAVGAAPREWVADAIQQAYEGESDRLQVSAVHAMGRSCEGRWLPLLVEELGSERPEMRYEAAQALGSLADRRAVWHLAALLQDVDQEVKEAAIAALGQIGGSEAKELLRPLLRDASSSVQEAAAAALTEAEFMEDPLSIEYRV